MAERIKFTDRAIQSLLTPAAGARAEYADTQTTGLRLRVSSSGVKTFSLLRRVKNGPMERITLGRFGDIKCEEAQRKATALAGLIAGGANPAELRRANKEELTFAELFNEYMERHSKLNKRTWQYDEQMYRDRLAKPLGKKKISKITRQDLSAIHSAITKTGKPVHANRVKDLFSSVFSKAKEWGYIDSNPAQGISDNPEKSRDRFLKGDELVRVFAALEGEENGNFRDYFLLALLTGARRGNLRSMRWADVDMDSLEWVIPDTKNGDPVRVPLVPEAAAILNERKTAAKPGATFVFPAARGGSKHGHTSGERKAWLRLLQRDEIAQLRRLVAAADGDPNGPEDEYPAEAARRLRALADAMKLNRDGARLQNIRIHDLRRTMGSWQARTGASLIIIGKSLGHRSQEATAVYARLDTDPVRASMETAASAMLEAGRQKPGADVLPYKKRA